MGEPQAVDKKDRDAVTELAIPSETVLRHVGDEEPRRVVYVPGKLINVVV